MNDEKEEKKINEANYWYRTVGIADFEGIA